MLTLAETPSALLRRMSDSLARVRDPRARHWLLLPGRGRAETLLHQWARTCGIAAHTQEVQLRVLLEQAAAGSSQRRFDFDRLRLAIAAVLPELSKHPQFPIPKTQALSPVTGSTLSWAGTLAKALDETFLCRPPGERFDAESFLAELAEQPPVKEALERHLGCISGEDFERTARSWLESWNRKGGVPHLWIQLDAGIPSVQFERFGQLIEFLSKEAPERLHLFALAPTAEYWAEAKLKRAASRNAPQGEAAFEEHPGSLLWAFGRCSQDLHRQIAGTFLAEGDGGTMLESPNPAPTLLGALQLSCRKSALPPEEERLSIQPDDHSLTVHSARSTLRELEICRDRILQARRELPELRYEEILLLLTDPKRQAPFVEAALRSDDPRHGLPYRMLGFGQAVPSPLAEAILLLLNKVRGRLTLEDLQILIEHPLIAAKFGFHEADQEGHALLNWLRDSQFRWGLDAEHRRTLQNIPEERWNLCWALQRLALGAIVSGEQRDAVLALGNGAQTVPLERASGLSLSSLAQLARFAELLRKTRELWAADTPHPVQEWNRRIQGLIEDFLDCGSGSPSQHLPKVLTEILPALAKAQPHSELLFSPDGYTRLLREKLDGLSETGARGTGGICVADLRQYAGVPARMILVAGLDEGVFPMRDERPDWHPLARSRKAGDPHLRDADRHALLLAILSCGERLVLSYRGGSDEESKDRPPSTALSDLLDGIDQSAVSAGNEPPHRAVLFKHPLNGFSPSAFSEKLAHSARGNLRGDYQSARALLERDGLPAFQGPWSQPIPEPAPLPEHLPVASLRTLLSEPARLFVERLGLRLPEEAEELEGGDLLSPGGLEKWQLRERALTARLEGQDTEKLFETLCAAGSVPRGFIGERLWQGILNDLPRPGSIPALTPANRILGDFQIQLRNPQNGGTLVLLGSLKPGWYRATDASGEKRAFFFSPSGESFKHELHFLLDALVLAAAGGVEPPLRKAKAFFKTEAVEVDLHTPQEARALLERLLPLLSLASQIPLPFWPKSAESLLDRAPSGQIDEIRDALELTSHDWAEGAGGRHDGPPESTLPATRFAYRGCNSPFLEHMDVPGASFLPDPDLPLAWRIAAFVRDWKTEAESPRP